MFVGIKYINKNANFQLYVSRAVFEIMTLTNMGKRSFFAPTQHNIIKTIITVVLLGAESWLTALFKALMQF